MTLDFEVHVDQNEYLPLGARTMDAVVSVTLTGDTLGDPGVDRGLARVIMIDTSGSMSGNKIAQAKLAVNAVVAALPDGVAFAIVAGTEIATMVYPTTQTLAEATPSSRKKAREAVGRLVAGGGTAIGTWLRLAEQLFASTRAPIRHAVLLTDGRNEHETTEQFYETVTSCEGKFTCDARGVGEGGWQARTLERIADTLHGSVRGLPDAAALAAEFKEITEKLMGTAAVDVTLRLWTPAHARLRFLKQVFPRIVDLTDRGSVISPRVRDYPTGHWAAETRDFHLSIEVDTGEVGEGLVAARVCMAVGDQQSTEHRVRAFWTDDPVLSTRISPQVAHFTGQQRMADLVREGVDAHQAGDLPRATDRLGRAIDLAKEHGNTETAAHLARLVEDDGAGTHRVRDRMADVLKEMAQIESKRTTRVRSEQE
ncbi:vWA domain-containing protein [Actinokineospora diospyrosa]|uniref:von Willebrand factor type A domain-containing protein n=1 Tax=Actinokineospora diospyrosa TaxID=103728 RepID=A0ABT1I8S1_9PSEU|nr:vWA domain-containing protein [Actinokineospora diospyrosa]MCP2269030.1 von Willebrand factor type A domain-containing protein [Actinokineospora diospyrosa]